MAARIKTGASPIITERIRSKVTLIKSVNNLDKFLSINLSYSFSPNEVFIIMSNCLTAEDDSLKKGFFKSNIILIQKRAVPKITNA